MSILFLVMRMLVGMGGGSYLCEILWSVRMNVVLGLGVILSVLCS